MTAVRLIPGLVLALALAACATSDDMVRQEAAHFDFLCEREFRAAREQPVPGEASGQEARALRGQHVSGRCRRAWNDAHGIHVPLNPPRIPAPVPLPPAAPRP